MYQLEFTNNLTTFGVARIMLFKAAFEIIGYTDVALPTRALEDINMNHINDMPIIYWRRGESNPNFVI